MQVTASVWPNLVTQPYSLSLTSYHLTVDVPSPYLLTSYHLTSCHCTILFQVCGSSGCVEAPAHRCAPSWHAPWRRNRIWRVPVWNWNSKPSATSRRAPVMICGGHCRCRVWAMSSRWCGTLVLVECGTCTRLILNGPCLVDLQVDIQSLVDVQVLDIHGWCFWTVLFWYWIDQPKHIDLLMAPSHTKFYWLDDHAHLGKQSCDVLGQIILVLLAVSYSWTTLPWYGGE